MPSSLSSVIVPSAAKAHSLLAEINMFTDKKFCDVRLAIGALVIAGYQCRWETVKDHSSVTGTIVVETEGGTKRIGTFRDGSTFAVKVELVQDLIDARGSMA